MVIQYILQRCYLSELQSCNSAVEPKSQSIRHDPENDNSMLDEVDQFLSICVVQRKGFIDILFW